MVIGIARVHVCGCDKYVIFVVVVSKSVFPIAAGSIDSWKGLEGRMVSSDSQIVDIFLISY